MGQKHDKTTLMHTGEELDLFVSDILSRIIPIDSVSPLFADVFDIMKTEYLEGGFNSSEGVIAS